MNPQLLDKLQRYCDYRDRAYSEVREKAMRIGISSEALDGYIESLEASGHLDELRYAKAFAQGRVRMRGWGMHKVRMHLRAKGVSSALITEALAQLDLEEYQENLGEIAKRKWPMIKGENDYVRKQKLYRFLAQRGFSTSDIREALGEVELG